MTAFLQDLIEAARIEAEPQDCCRDGHDWQTDGGRTCPKGDHNMRSQPVYKCARCGDYDYGEPGGPAHADCKHCDCTLPCETAPNSGEFDHEFEWVGIGTGLGLHWECKNCGTVDEGREAPADAIGQP
jgi:hypothetical protein